MQVTEARWPIRGVEPPIAEALIKSNRINEVVNGKSH
jgi:hypothetical protein